MKLSSRARHLCERIGSTLPQVIKPLIESGEIKSYKGAGDLTVNELRLYVGLEQVPVMTQRQRVFDELAHCQCVQRSTGQRFIASKWAYHIVSLANKLAQADPMAGRYRPEVGDIVCEFTHTLMFGAKGLANDASVGELMIIENDPKEGKVYTIKGFNGKTLRWSNAMLVLVQKKTTP